MLVNVRILVAESYASVMSEATPEFPVTTSPVVAGVIVLGKVSLIDELEGRGRPTLMKN